MVKLSNMRGWPCCSPSQAWPPPLHLKTGRFVQRGILIDSFKMASAFTPGHSKLQCALALLQAHRHPAVHICICPAPRRAIAVAPCTCTLQSPAHSMVQIYRCMPHCFPPSATAVFHFFFELQQRFLHPAIVNRLPYWTRTCPSRHAKVSTTSCTHQCIPTNMSSQNMIRDSPPHQDFVKHSC